MSTGSGLPLQVIVSLMVYNLQQDISSDITYNYVRDLEIKKRQLQDNFQKTLDMIPNGVLLVDCR